MTYPSGYLSYGALPSFTRQRPCRFCGQPVESSNRAGAICPAQPCQEAYQAGLKAREARYARKYYRRHRVAS